MARALWLADAAFEALPMIEKAVDLEPNAFHYRRTHIELVRATQQFAFALHLYRQVTGLFENVHDLDELATEILLDAGKPEEAKQCLPRAIVSGGRRVELDKAVDDAVAARTRALELMRAARASVTAKDWSAASSALLRAQEIYNRDAELCMNTAFATLHEGDPRICAALMLHASSIVSEPLAAVCAANAGIAMLKTHDVEGAMTILDIAARRLSWLHGGEIPANEVDLPSVGVWIEDDTLIEERVSVAELYIRRGLEQAAAKGIDVPERVRTLAAAYSQAAAAAH
jgi:tetratricopeptide (TPR) repeat protein